MRAKTESRQRTKPPEERRDELMNAAQYLFLKQGVASTTIEQITLRAEVAKGTFYLYFSSKEDILTALGDRFGQEHLAGIKAAMAAHTKADWKGQLATWANACVFGYLDSIRLHDIVFYGSRPATREGLIDNIVIDHLCALLQAGLEAKAWSIDDARSTAVFLFSGLHAVVDDAYSKKKKLHRTELAQKIERLCFRALGIAPG